MSAAIQAAPTLVADDFVVPTIRRPTIRRTSDDRPPFPPKYSSIGRRLIGLGLIFAVVVLWTASGFLQSSIFADNTYSKPWFLTYINTAFFTLPAAPYLVGRAFPQRARRWLGRNLPSRLRIRYEALDNDHDEPVHANHPTPQDPPRNTNIPNTYETIEHGVAKPTRRSVSHTSQDPQDKQPLLTRTTSRTSTTSTPLTTRETFSLSIRFCLLWYLANYTNAASLHFTSVASFTIISTTSSIFTLIFGALSGVEAFTTRKLLGVLACMAGVVLTAIVETNAQDEPARGLFPAKSPADIFTGDALALVSAGLYGAYCVLLAQRVGDESRIAMPLFFGFLGVLNIVCLWPGFPLLDALRIEPFALPPDGRVWGIIIANALSSLVSDLCWAYAVLFTSPLVVTVGLSLTIPLSLVGQIVIDGQYAPALYWLGAAIVVMSFVFVNYESAADAKKREDEDAGIVADLEAEVDEEEVAGTGQRRRRESFVDP